MLTVRGLSSRDTPVLSVGAGSHPFTNPITAAVGREKILQIWLSPPTAISIMHIYLILFAMFLGKYGVPLLKFKDLLPGYFFAIELPFHIGVWCQALCLTSSKTG